MLNLAKWVPLVGGPIGAAVDGFSCRTIAAYAERTFEAQRPRAVPGPAADAVPVPPPGPPA